MNKFGLESKDIESIRHAIASVAGVEKAILYGSRAMGNFKPYSDIDISLIGDNLTVGDLIHLHTIIDDLMLPFEVDINIYHLLRNDCLRDHIKRRGVELDSRTIT